MAPRHRKSRLRWRVRRAGPEVQSLDRAIALLRVVADADGMALAEIARRAELPVSTVHRRSADHPGEAPAGQPRPVRRTVDRGAGSVPHRCRLSAHPQAARHRPAGVRRLLHETDETVNLAMFDAMEPVVVAQAEAPAPLRAFFRLGARLPLHATAARPCWRRPARPFAAPA